MKTVHDTAVLNYLLLACIKTATSSVLIDVLNYWYFLHWAIENHWAEIVKAVLQILKCSQCSEGEIDKLSVW